MSDASLPTLPANRRRFLVRAILAVQALIAAPLALVLGGAVLGPAFTRRDRSWLRAAAVGALRDDEPLPVTLRVAREDGYAQVVDRTVVYLVRTEGDAGVRALSSTCTHLGCRTSYDRATRRIVCPCHGGVFDLQGNVVEGPPPEPLRALPCRVESGQILVQI